MVSIDFIIIGGFLILTLVMGLYHGKGIKTFKDYAVGGRKLSTVTISLSMLATIYGGSMLISRPHHYYQQGLYALLIDLASPLNFYLACRFVIPQMKEFIGHLSIAESMGKLYGPIAACYTAILGIMISIAGLSFQIKIGFNIITILFPEIEQFSIYSTIFLATLIIVYASFGGARAVALTDVYQFLFFGLCFPVLIFSLLYYAKDPIAGWQKLSNMPMFNLQKIATWDTALICVLSHFIWRSIFPFDPARVQRFYMVASLSQAQKVFKQTALIRIIVLLLFLSLAIALHVGNHVIPSNQNVLYYIVKLAYFPGLRGILATTLIALLMSTADSCLHVASVLFAHDLWPVVSKWIKCNRLTTAPLTIARIASVGIGIMGLTMVLYANNMVQLLSKTFSMYGSIVSVPFIMACFGFRPRPAAVLLSMAINTLLTIYRIYFSTPTAPQLSALEAVVSSGQTIFLSLILSALILITIHYLLPKVAHTGWVGIQDRSAWDLQNQLTKRWWSEKIQQLKAPFTAAHRAYFFPKNEKTFVCLGSYIIMATIGSLCFIHRNYIFPHIYTYMAVMAIGTIIAVYPALHKYQRGGTPLLHWIWLMLLFLLLFIAPMQFAKLGHYSPMVCALCVCSIGLSSVLLSRVVSIGMLLVAFLIQSYLFPHPPFWICFCTPYHQLPIEPIYAIAFIVAVGAGMVTYKRLRDQSAAKLKVMELTRTYEHRISLEAIYNQANWSRLHALEGSKLLQNLADQLKETCYDLYKDHPHKLNSDREIDRFVGKLYKLGDTMLWRAKEERSLKLDEDALQLTAIEPVILKANQYILNLGEPLALLLRKHTNVQEILVDPSLFECFLMLNLWEISKSKQAANHIIVLTTEDTTLQYSADKEVLSLPALAFWFSTDTAIKKVAQTYLVSETDSFSTLPASQEQFYQIECRQMVAAHGGYTEIIESCEALSCLYVLPIKGHKVMHFKNYNPIHLVGGKIAETTESLAQEKELISLLTSNTSLTQEQVIQVIAFIKNAHGLVKRKSGAPYYTHPMATAKILLTVTQDPITILSGLLHDVVEDTPVTLNQIEMIYGSQVADIIDKVTGYHTNGYCWKLEKSEQKSILETCGDIRVVQVKLADRLHNMRTLYVRKRADQQRIAQETLTFYIPWGKRNKGPEAWLQEMQRMGAEILQHKDS